MKKQNVAYLRVSTEAQTEKYGLDMQKQKIIEYCEKNKITIDKWYIDGGYSGSKLDRPMIQELLDDAERGKIEKVFIYKLDRISRDVIDTLNLLHRILPKYGVRVISMTEDLKIENPMDKVMIGVNAIMGQYEREVIYMRTRAGMVERVKKGLWMGGGRVPFGYYYDRNDGILHPKEGEARLVKEAFELYIEGYSCDAISKLLGFKGERIVMQILNRKSNIGIIEYKGKEYKGKHEPIVSEELFYKAQKCMKKRHTNSYVNNKNLLTGLCYCGICGARMRYQKWGDYHKILCYSQQSSKEYMIKDPNCDNYKVKAADIEYEVEKCFKEFAIKPEKEKRTESKAKMLEENIKKSNSKIKKYYSLYAENEDDNLLELIKEERERVKVLEKELGEEKDKERQSDDWNVDKIKKVTDVWDNLTNKEKNRELKQYIDKIIITKDNIEVRFVIP